MKFLCRFLILLLFATGCNISDKDENKNIEFTKHNSKDINKNDINFSDSSELEFYTTKDEFTFFENK